MCEVVMIEQNKLAKHFLTELNKIASVCFISSTVLHRHHLHQLLITVILKKNIR